MAHDDEIQLATPQVKAFAALAEALAQEEDLEAILDAYSRHLPELLACDRASISVVVGDQQISWHVERGGKIQEIERTQSASQGTIVSQVMRDQKPVILDDLASMRGVDADPELMAMRGAGARSSIVYPLLFQGTSIGAIDIESNQPHAYSEQDLPIARLVANQIALAMTRVRLSQESSERLEEASGQLIQAGKMATVGMLAAMMAHEIKNRLNVIKFGSQTLQEMAAAQLAPQLGSVLTSVIQAADEGDRLLRGFLGHARPQAPIQEEIDVRHLMEQMLQIMPKTNLKVVSHFGSGRLTVIGDPSQLGQVFINLLLNGLEAMPKGGTLTVKAHVRGDHLEITVQDTGTGISPSDLSKIFQPFYTTKSGGVGLGMSISRLIVERHGGSLSLESRLGEGTTVTISLPLAGVARQAA